MPQTLSRLRVDEVSLVDRPANSEIINGQKVRRATVALFKRDGEEEEEDISKAVDGQSVDGTVFPASDFAYVPDKDHMETQVDPHPGR